MLCTHKASFENKHCAQRGHLQFSVKLNKHDPCIEGTGGEEKPAMAQSHPPEGAVVPHHHHLHHNQRQEDKS